VRSIPSHGAGVSNFFNFCEYEPYKPSYLLLIIAAMTGSLVFQPTTSRFMGSFLTLCHFCCPPRVEQVNVFWISRDVAKLN
jgi:hypothetical protein